MSTLTVAMISKTVHSATHRAALENLGFEVRDLGGRPTEIPQNADIVVCRTQSCSHHASGMAYSWSREAGRKDRLVVSNSLAEIVGRCVHIRRVSMGDSKPVVDYQVHRVSGAMRFILNEYGFYRVGMCDWMSAAEVEAVADGLGFSGSLRGTEEEPSLQQAVLTLRGSYLPTQERRLLDLTTGLSGHVLLDGCTRKTGPVLKDDALAERLLRRLDLMELLRVPGWEQLRLPAGSSEPDEPVAEVCPTAGKEPAGGGEPVVEEEPLVPEAAATPPLPEAHEAEKKQSEAPKQQLTPIEEVEEAIRLLHSYMQDAGVDRITLTQDSAEVVRTVRSQGKFNFGAL